MRDRKLQFAGTRSDGKQQMLAIGREGMTLLPLERDVWHALDMCNRGYVFENGRNIKEGKVRELKKGPTYPESVPRIF